MATVQTVIDLVRAETNHDGDQQVTDVQITLFCDLDYQFVRRRVMAKVPSIFEKQKIFTLVSNTQDLTAAPASLTDFERIVRFEVQEGADFAKMDVASEYDPELMAGPAYLERGRSVDFYPSAYTMAGKVVKLTYLTKADTLDAPGDPLDIPAGLEAVVASRVKARVRGRMFETNVDPDKVGIDVLDEHIKDLRKRYRKAPVPGFTPGRRW